MEVYVTILLETFRWLPLPTRQNPHAPAWHGRPFRLWPQAASCPPVHKVQPQNVSCHFPEIPSLTPLRFFSVTVPFWARSCCPGKFFFDTQSRRQRPAESALLAQGAQYLNNSVPCLAVSKMMSSGERLPVRKSKVSYYPELKLWDQVVWV